MAIKKVLIVDDSRTIRQQVSFTLVKGGYSVVEAEDGTQGLEVLEQHPDIALVISDVNMPNMGGLDMVRKIKISEKHASLPILMLTTEDSADMIAQAKEAGASGWVTKPFKPDQLIAGVTKLTA